MATDRPPAASAPRTALLLLVPAALLLAGAVGAWLASRPHVAAVLAGLHVLALAGFHLRRIRLRTERLERALREATETREARAADLARLQAILDSMVDGVLFIDAEDRVAMVNAAGRALRNLGGPGRPAQPTFAPVSVNRLLREAAHKAALARGLPDEAVRLELAPDLPVLDVDGAMICEALVNLLQNAFDAGGAAAPELASRFEAAGGEGTIAVEVRDRGAGIPPDQLDEVLRPFVTTKPTGTGLGLVVVTRAVEQHRARFQLSAREGGGTVAAIRFPVRRTQAAPVPEVA